MSWYLDSVSDTLEVREDSATGTIQTREHRTVTLFQKDHHGAQFNSECGDVRGAISWTVGTATFTKSLSNPKKYVCVSDALVDVVQETSYSRRVQIWEHFSAWETTTDFEGT